MAFVLTSVFCIMSSNVAYASEKTYSDVMTDLTSDSSFDKSKYNEDATRTDMEVITIAESEDYELFVYVFQPRKELVASSINISLSKETLSFKNYFLTLINQNGVYQKYKVDNLTTSTAQIKYYEIPSIYRKFDSSIDKSLSDDNNNTINEVAFNVGLAFTLTLDSSGTSIKVENVDTISVTEMFVGFCRYPTVSWFDSTQADVHFVAFSTTWLIDDLLEVDIYYNSQPYERNGLGLGPYPTETNETGSVWGPIDYDGHAELKKDKDIVYENDSGIWRDTKYSFASIETPENFFKTEAEGQIYNMGLLNQVTTSVIDENAKNVISRQQWVCRFAVTEYDYVPSSSQFQGDTESFTRISNVSIMRLAFISNNQYYNLGVVSNKQTGSDDPVNETETVVSFTEDFLQMIKILLGLIALVIICMFISPIMAILTPILKLIVNFVVWVITLPFKLIATLFKK